MNHWVLALRHFGAINLKSIGDIHSVLKNLNRWFIMVKRVHINVFVVTTLLLGCSIPPFFSVRPSVDMFHQIHGNEAKIDILWVIDNSLSMADEQEALRENFNSFITNFIKKGYDYRIAVITTDAYYTGSYYHDSTLLSQDEVQGRVDYMDVVHSNESLLGTGVLLSYLTSEFVDGDLTKDYCNKNSHLPTCVENTEGYMLSGYKLIESSNTTIDFTEYEPSSPVYEIGHEDYISNNIKNIFAVNSNVGIQGLFYESGLRSVQTALNNPVNKALNFPRSGAHLAVIVVSDEEDQIEGSTALGRIPADIINNIPVSEYDDFLKSLVDPEYGYSFHAIVKFEGDTCGVNSNHPVGARYIKLSELSGGTQASICEDFAESLDDIAQTIIERVVEFPLTDTPANLNQLQVLVKNPGATVSIAIPQDIENGWTYNASANSIVFHGTAIPIQDSEISILYEPTFLFL